MSGKAAKVLITERQQPILEQMSRSATISFRLRQRAQIILLAFEGRLNEEFELIVGLGHDQVGKWRRRWQRAFERLTLIEGLEEPAALKRQPRKSRYWLNTKEKVSGLPRSPDV